MDIDEGVRGRLADSFEAICPSADRIIMPAGYRDSAFALLDAVFSMQARYEGARRVVANYASWVGLSTTPGLPVNSTEPDEHSLVELRDRLAGMAADDIAVQVFNNRARSPRANRLKADLVIEAAERLIGVDVRTRHDVALLPTDDAYRQQKLAWSDIRGLGPVTFEYFRMLCGAESSKPDVMILGWLEDTLGRRYTWQQALELVAMLADELSVRWDVEVSQRGIDHTIWRYQSGRGLDPNAPVGWAADVGPLKP